MKDDVEFKYLFAEKPGREFCVKYDTEWEMPCFDYLMERGYKLTAASEQHWNRMINVVGHTIPCYLLDKDLSVFDIGNY